MVFHKERHLSFPLFLYHTHPHDVAGCRRQELVTPNLSKSLEAGGQMAGSAQRLWIQGKGEKEMRFAEMEADSMVGGKPESKLHIQTILVTTPFSLLLFLFSVVVGLDYK